MLGDVLRRMVTTGLGVVIYTREKAEEVVNGFVRDGAVSRAEADRLVDELLAQAQNQRDELRNLISEQTKKVLDGAGLVRREEHEALLRRVEALEMRLAEGNSESLDE